MGVRKRDHLLTVARRMFCAEGFRAVGVDAVLEEAGVARMTLYKNFGSKEDLIVAALREEAAELRRWLAARVDARASGPEERIAQLFLSLQERFTADGFYGCTFTRASAEYPDSRHPIHRAAKEHKEIVRSYIRRLAVDTGAENAIALAEQIYLLFEGAVAAAQLHGEPWPADYAGQAARQLVKAARGRDILGS